MVSAAGRREQSEWLAPCKRVTRLHHYFIGLVLALTVIIGWNPLMLQAQTSNIRIEFAARLPEGETLVHVRVPRGQTIASASVETQQQQAFALVSEPVPLPTTQWIVLDASDAMVNLQAAVQSSLTRFLRNIEGQTGIIIYSDEVQILRPTTDTQQITEFVNAYSASVGADACVADALSAIAADERLPEQSLRILLVTSAITRQSGCAEQTLPVMPAPLDVVLIAEEEDPALVDAVTSSGGTADDISIANLRTVDARLTEVRTRWGQPTFALRGDAIEGTVLRSTLVLTLDNNRTEELNLRFRTYNIPAPDVPTATPTEIELATVPPPATDTPLPATAEATDEALAAGGANPTASPEETVPVTTSGGGDNVALLLVAGAILFIVGAVILALALSRVGRQPQALPQAAAMPGSSDVSRSFYESLEETPAPAADARSTPTKPRERDLVSNAADEELGMTQIADGGSAVTPMPQGSPTEYIDPYGPENDDLIVTQVLGQKGVQQMITQSRDDAEIVGVLRLEGASEGDYQLTRAGMVIGRGRGSDIQVTGDSAISRQHARIDVQDDGQVTVSRMSAINPVVVGGKQVSNRYPLKPRDVIHLSDRTRLIYIAKQSGTRSDEGEADES